ncbi:unnamed protein product [Macrosiphum euphorbiae]|uniref:PiggyBac transposable element-derived protein 4-like n=1 Tax=Macrosiphum euphorbiae TaxID=13131 RepID=A0AAV0W425_9HEMI|nr:unnamed protein product [Macrosiphum euphorbiae]CAI6364015.1 unnamed protein product [Macrosiphum euphorbiae]CAI6367545.1 unnamed protein product [Macrosiphum euphorbiae]
MNRRQISEIQNYLNESDSGSSLFSCGDDSDNDPSYEQPRPHSQSLPPVRCSFDSGDDCGPELTGSNNYQNSDDNLSVDDSSSESSDDNSDTDSWVEDYADIPDYAFDDSHSGIKLNISESSREFPIEIFTQFWTDDIFDMVIESTNKYGENLSKANRPHKKNARASTFKPVDLDEIKRFLGICLLGGAVKFSVIRDMFSQNPLYYHPVFNHIMSGRRFDQILNCFSVQYTDRYNNEVIGPMMKVQPLFDTLIQNFQTAFIPTEHLSIDESLLLHRGRIIFRQYIKNKKARYGIKFYELTSYDGYVLNIEMYQGKQEQSAVPSRTSKIDSIVLRLMNNYLNKGFSLYMDNYYNSVTLSNTLLELKTHTTGTLRKNRKGNPKVVVDNKLKKGQHVWRRKNNVYVSKWKDKRDVLCITTRVHPKLIQSENRYGQQKNKPSEIVEYNNYMNGVDRSDQMVSYYSSPRKTCKWYKKVIFHLLDVTVWNSFFIYKKHFDTPNMKFKAFRDLLIKNLFNIPNNVTANELFVLKKKPSIPPATNHYQERIPIPENYKRTIYYKNCLQCYKTNKIRKQTSFQCKQCAKPLCAGFCFEAYHKNL